MPSTRRLGSPTIVVATVVMAALLVALAILQYHWVGEVSEAARERLGRELETAADRIRDDFDREVFRAFVAFQPPRPIDAGTTEGGAEQLADALSDGWERWQASALEPGLVSAVYVVEPDHAGGQGDGALWRLDPAARALRPADWPPELIDLDRRLDPPAGSGRRAPGPRPRSPRLPALTAAPALVLPIRPPPRARRFDQDEPPEGGGFVIVLLDRDFIGHTVLPGLLDLHLGPEPREIEALVLDRTHRDEPVYATGSVPERPSRPGPGVAMRPLLALRFFPELRAQGFRRFFDDPDARRLLDSERRDGGPPPGLQRSFHGGPPDQGQWALILARSEGSLDAAVSHLRRRNLGVGLAVVTLLGATAALLLVSARQVQRLARREMELVAGITHELRTPLTAIGSAADNLADGVVQDPAQVRRYGSLIRGETHRLGTLVAQVLDFAGGAAARRRARPLEAIDVSATIDRVLADLRFLIDEKNFSIERIVSPDLPPALADGEALRRALDNVIGNALKYGEAGRWIGIELTTVGSGPAARIVVRVRDRGPGITRADRRRVFEPFYRGAGADAPHLHGTGLGLAVTKSVLESFGGTIEIEDSEAARGTTFKITLPPAPAAARAESTSGGEEDEAPGPTS